MIAKLCIVCALSSGLVVAQSPAAADAAKKPLAFEVVSIRQNVSNANMDAFGATPDGFRMVNVPLGRLILTAYVPQTGAALYWEPKGFPAWVTRNSYDIEARVADADRAQWQNPALQPEMMRAMLQQLLADRCHLVVHRALEDAAVYYLEVGKNGPKLKESKAGEAYPQGQESRFPGGGIFLTEGETMRFYRAPMTLLASILTNRNLGGRPVLDHTGLTGRYDFVVPWGAWTAGGVGAANDTSDPGPTLNSSVEAVGLKLVSAQGKVENLVVDHIERPSGN